MAKKPTSKLRREDSLSKDRIIEAAIEILDQLGESGLTFQSLSLKLETGPGAIYWHVENKSELKLAACDALVARTLKKCTSGKNPKKSLRALSVGIFDAIDEHPWVGSALIQSPGKSPMVRIFERIGQHVQALGVKKKNQWIATSTLLNYIFGVGGQNASNSQYAKKQDLNREAFLKEVSNTWAKLDLNEYPFARSMTKHLSSHDDRADFIAGIDLIVKGMI